METNEMLQFVVGPCAHAMIEHGPDGHCDGADEIALGVLDAIPDGWAKVDGGWVRLRPRTPQGDAGRRLYEEA